MTTNKAEMWLETTYENWADRDLFDDDGVYECWDWPDWTITSCRVVEPDKTGNLKVLEAKQFESPTYPKDGTIKGEISVIWELTSATEFTLDELKFTPWPEINGERLSAEEYEGPFWDFTNDSSDGENLE